MSKRRAKHAPAFAVGDRVEIAPHFDLWVRGDRYGDVKGDTALGVYVKMDKSGKTLRFAQDDLTRVNPRRRRKVTRRHRVVRRRARKNPGATVTRFAASRGLAFSESGVLTDVLKDLKALTRESLTRSQMNTLQRVAYALGLLKSQAAHGIHENPMTRKDFELMAALIADYTLRDYNIEQIGGMTTFAIDLGKAANPRFDVFRFQKRVAELVRDRAPYRVVNRAKKNPGALAVVGALNPPLGRAIEVRYHRTAGKYPGYYRHKFKTSRATVFAMADGSLRIVGR